MLKYYLLLVVSFFAALCTAQINIPLFKADSTDAKGNSYARCYMPAEFAQDTTYVHCWEDSLIWPKFVYPTFDTTYVTYLTKPSQSTWNEYLEEFDSVFVKTTLNNYQCTLRVTPWYTNLNYRPDTNYYYEYLWTEEDARKNFERLKSCYDCITEQRIQKEKHYQWFQNEQEKFEQKPVQVTYQTTKKCMLNCRISSPENYCDEDFGKKRDTSFYALIPKVNNPKLATIAVKTYATKLNNEFNFNPDPFGQCDEEYLYKFFIEYLLAKDARIEYQQVLVLNDSKKKKLKKLLVKNDHYGSLKGCLINYQMDNKLPIGQFDLKTLKHIGFKRYR